MATTRRRKLEIIVEAPVLSRVERMLSEEGVRGWSVFSGVGGHGTHGDWRTEGLSGAEDKRLIFALCGEEAAARVLDRLAAFFQDYPGIVCVTDVEVMRGERF
jgi:PII-like signaling protein